jgi:hypothetical protein
MMAARIRLSFLPILIFGLGAFSSARAQEPSTNCVAIRLIKDGKTIEGPRSVTFLNQAGKQDVDIREGKFCVPELMAHEPALDFTFVLGKERFFFPRLPEERFQASWDISFGRDIKKRLAGLPQAKKANQACIVEFNQGEPGTGMILSPCRGPNKPLK